MISKEETEKPKEVISIDYRAEYHRLQEMLKQEIEEKEKYKKALLNVCLKM